MNTSTLIALSVLSVICQEMNIEGKTRPRNALTSFRRCLGMPQKKHASKRTMLNYIRRHFALVPLHSTSPRDINTSAVPRRVPRTVAPGGYCPYTIESEEVRNRIPRFLAYASCREEVCNPAFCKPVMYSHKVLVQKCNGVWEWSEKTLPVAFIPVV